MPDRKETQDAAHKAFEQDADDLRGASLRTRAPSTLIQTHPLLLQHADGSPWCGPVECRAHDGQEYMDGIWGIHGWDEDHAQRVRLDTRRPEVRDQCSRVLGRILGVPVGATAPEWRYRCVRGVSEWSLVVAGHTYAHWCAGDTDGRTCQCTSHPPDGWCLVALSSIPFDSPDRDVLALASVVRWALVEVEAGRLGKGGTR